jgi:hypothetical protein
MCEDRESYRDTNAHPIPTETTESNVAAVVQHTYNEKIVNCTEEDGYLKKNKYPGCFTELVPKFKQSITINLILFILSLVITNESESHG